MVGTDLRNNQPSCCRIAIAHYRNCLTRLPGFSLVQRLVAALRHTFNASQSQQLSHPFSASSTSPNRAKSSPFRTPVTGSTKMACEWRGLRTTATASAQILPFVLVYLQEVGTKSARRQQGKHSITGTEPLFSCNSNRYTKLLESSLTC